LHQMISGPPPGRIAQLFTAWADWLLAKLSPPEPTRDLKTQPPKLVKSDRDAAAAQAATKAAARR
jgi:hypothetical protein